jgi:hypothetical protein
MWDTHALLAALAICAWQFLCMHRFKISLYLFSSSIIVMPILRFLGVTFRISFDLSWNIWWVMIGFIVITSVLFYWGVFYVTKKWVRLILAFMIPISSGALCLFIYLTDFLDDFSKSGLYHFSWLAFLDLEFFLPIVCWCLGTPSDNVNIDSFESGAERLKRAALALVERKVYFFYGSALFAVSYGEVLVRAESATGILNMFSGNVGAPTINGFLGDSRVTSNIDGFAEMLTNVDTTHMALTDDEEGNVPQIIYGFQKGENCASVVAAGLARDIVLTANHRAPNEMIDVTKLLLDVGGSFFTWLFIITGRGGGLLGDSMRLLMAQLNGGEAEGIGGEKVTPQLLRQVGPLLWADFAVTKEFRDQVKSKVVVFKDFGIFANTPPETPKHAFKIIGVIGWLWILVQTSWKSAPFLLFHRQILYNGVIYQYERQPGATIGFADKSLVKIDGRQFEMTALTGDLSVGEQFL